MVPLLKLNNRKKGGLRVVLPFRESFGLQVQGSGGGVGGWGRGCFKIDHY